MKVILLLKKVDRIKKGNAGSTVLLERVITQDDLDSLLKITSGKKNLVKICTNNGANQVVTTLLTEGNLETVQLSKWEIDDIVTL